LDQFSETASSAATIAGSAPNTAIEGLYLSDNGVYFNILNGLTGSGDNDLIVGTAGNNNLVGNAGADIMFGGAGNDTLNGGEGDDMLDGGAGNDALNGGNGDDEFGVNELTGGDDTISDTGGKDVLVWHSSQANNLYVDISRGGASASNADLLIRVYQEGALKQTTTVKNQFSASKATDAAISAKAKAPVTAIEGLYLSDAELYFNLVNGLTGSKGNDLIVGTGGNNTLAGNAGSDLMFGGAGNDKLNGGVVDDMLDGGAGNDALSGGKGNDEYWISELTGGNDTISDTSGDDQLAWHSSNADNLYVDISRGGSSSSNADMLIRVYQEGALKQTTTVKNQFSASKATDATISAKAKVPVTAVEGFYLSDDDVYFNILNGLTGTGANDLIVGTAGNNTLVGYGGSDIMFGGAGNDTIDGGEGDDMLDGGAGNDVLKGGNGEDDLRGGLGNDILYGGAGSDTFTFDTLLNAFTNLDTIKDFETGVDKIMLDAQVFKAFSGQIEIVSSQITIMDFEYQLSGNGYLTYVRSNDTLYYDHDGVGSGDLAFDKIELAGASAPSASDFEVIG
jgi:Ca2+-binding RTX toxin-like protein